MAAGGVQAWWWALVLNGQRLALLTCAGGRTAEVECRRDMLRYKRRIDDVVRELLRMLEDRAPARR